MQLFLIFFSYIAIMTFTLAAAPSELSLYIYSDDVILPEPSIFIGLSRTFHIVLQVENVLEVSLLLAGGMSSWYTTPAITELSQVAVALSKRSSLLILRKVTAKLSISRS
jgi:hypothetical protein